MNKFNLVEVEDLFAYYLEYVKSVIAEYDKEQDVRPMSFDEWYHREYLTNIHEFTMSVSFEVVSKRKNIVCRCTIPEGVFTESGGLLDTTLLDVLVNRLKDKLPSVSLVAIGRYRYEFALK